eukprot:TRINITY_DN9720_c0_g1_i1.p1 TRINITY_DN9720_c0_g1~~TRINITY_DN9720_c0_g1_i1.p1  ORF type:complete len:615 (+),score=211.40 TRINITY_DN9720_c0_g1_i1:89-1933(+)
MPGCCAIRAPNVEPSSHANLTEVRVRHVAFDWDVDFEKKEICGSATMTADVLQDTERITLDTRNLHVTGVTVNGTDAPHSFGDTTDAFGAALQIQSPPLSKGTEATVSIRYATSPGSSALNWLAPAQTVGGKHPYLFSQCQAIHARSLFPCQDTPGNRATYEAKVTAPAPLRALMSALQEGAAVEEAGKITTRFRQPIAIASYLVAIVVGHVEKRDVSERVAVWSEPELVDIAAHDFADTEKVIAIGESLVGPYEWGRYDVVSLPGSFPYGGMENPCLTFVSPSIVTGDRSLFNVVAHEVAHSWTGNLVGPNTWEDFYLNEGFTMFLERRIMSELLGEDYFDFDALQGGTGLRETISRLGEDNPYTALRPDLRGVDPDDSFSTVPYEKGFAFLCYLRSVVGSNADFDAWLRVYIQAHRHKMITTEIMIGHLTEYFTTEGRSVDFSQVDWAKWLDAPGHVPVCVLKESKLDVASKALCDKWVALLGGEGASVSPADLEGWSSAQTCRTMELFTGVVKERDVPPAVLTKLNDAYGFNKTPNSEILFLWLVLCICHGWSGHEEVLKSFLGRVGRMKFALPLYRNLHKKDPVAAKALFEELKPRYHPITTKMAEKIFA